MGKLLWDQTGEHFFETGVNQGVLYPQVGGKYPKGVAWNGLTNVTENPSGAEATDQYADNIKYLSLRSTETFGATVEAFTYPDEFAMCDGSAELAEGITVGQQKRQAFGMAYKTILGNDTEMNDYAYKLHLIYGATASPSQKSFATVNDTPEAVTFSWELATTPVSVAGFKPTASVVVDSSKADAAKLAKLEKILFGFDLEEYSDAATYAVGDFVTEGGKTYECITAVTAPESFDSSKWVESTETGVARLPLPDEIKALFV